MTEAIGSVRFGTPPPDVKVRVVCDLASPFHDRHGLTVIMDFLREDRWDGSGGHYWTTLAPMTELELERFHAAGLGDVAAVPRARRDPDRAHGGFLYLRDGVPVTDVVEAREIGNALHHAAGPHRRGTPRAGILDGVTRHLELRCRCGERVTANARDAEATLDALTTAGATTVTLVNFKFGVREVATRRKRQH